MSYRTRRRTRANRSGMMTLVNLILVAWIVLIISFIYNADRISQSRTRTQIAADYGAASVGDAAADNMKELVAINHTIGELLSKVIIHDAWGGPGLDNNEEADTSTEDNLLLASKLAYEGAALAANYPSRVIAYDVVKEEVIASEESTEFVTKTRLKELLTWTYGTKTIACGLIASKFPKVVAIGIAIHEAANLFELKIKQEYETANLMHKAMSALVPIKQNIRDVVLPQLKRQTDQIVSQFPELAKQYAQDLSLMHI